jgi:hypothetical protein
MGIRTDVQKEERFRVRERWRGRGRISDRKTEMTVFLRHSSSVARGKSPTTSRPANGRDTATPPTKIKYANRKVRVQN